MDSENPIDAAGSEAAGPSIPAPAPPSPQLIDEAIAPKGQGSERSSPSLTAVESFKLPEWEPLAHTGCHGVDHRVLVAQPNFVLALLRFALNATIHEHPAQWPIDVYCLEGSGSFSVDGVAASISAGQRVRWPPNVPHRLWTERATMTTLMVENPPSQ